MKKVFLITLFISSALLGSVNEFKPLQALEMAVQEAINEEEATNRKTSNMIIRAVQDNNTQYLKEIFNKPISNKVLSYFLNDIKYLKNLSITQRKNFALFIHLILSKAIYHEDIIPVRMIYENFPYLISEKVSIPRQLFLRNSVASHRLSSIVYLKFNTDALGYAIAIGSARMVHFLIETCKAKYNYREHGPFLACIRCPDENLIQYHDTKKEVIAYLNAKGMRTIH